MYRFVIRKIDNKTIIAAMKKLLKHTPEWQFRELPLLAIIFESMTRPQSFHHSSLKRQMFAHKIVPFS